MSTSLNAATAMTFVDIDSLQYWKGIATIYRTLEAGRTYPHGLSIPESGYVSSETIDATAYEDYRPTGTEIWKVSGIAVTSASGTPAVNVYLTDGSNVCLMHTGTTATTGTSLFPFESSFDITNTLFLRILNADASIGVTVNVAYTKVGL